MAGLARTADREARGAFDREDLRKRKRDAVLRVAAQAFNRRGFANTSMEDVAAALGVSKPTVYQYFDSKQEILYHCHQLAMDQGEAALALARAHAGTGFQKLTIYLAAYMQGIFGELGTCPVLTDVDSLGSEQRDNVVARRARISAATADIIRAGIADGSIVECDPKLASLFILGAVNWIPLWYRETGPNTPDEITRAFLAFLGSGFAGSA